MYNALAILWILNCVSAELAKLKLNSQQFKSHTHMLSVTSLPSCCLTAWQSFQANDSEYQRLTLLTYCLPLLLWSTRPLDPDSWSPAVWECVCVCVHVHVSEFKCRYVVQRFACACLVRIRACFPGIQIICTCWWGLPTTPRFTLRTCFQPRHDDTLLAADTLAEPLNWTEAHRWQ